jgi:23S rRNA (cytosine1962-C5)-methyltransferase
VSDPFAVAGRVRLQPGRERSLVRRHPWLYRGALAGELPAGEGPVEVCDSRGVPQGIALVGGSGGSLALRMLTFGDARWDEAALRARLEGALALRRRLGIDSDAWRLVHAEGDELPGLVIDRYGAVAVVEPFEPAWDPYLGLIAGFLTAEAGIDTVLQRAGSARRTPVQAIVGAVPGSPVVIREGRARFPVDLQAGQKTGFFLDQRDNRRRLGELAGERTVLNLFSYSGAFAVAALVAGARRGVNVDESAPALALAREAYGLNGLTVSDEDFLPADAFDATRRMIAAGGRFDVVVVDPPAFAKRRAELPAGLRGYRDINLQALRLVAPGGVLLSCSCSALVDESSFLGALHGAALDARRRVRVLERRGAAPDHPLSLFCLESRHLQAWLCAVE